MSLSVRVLCQQAWTSVPPLQRHEHHRRARWERDGQAGWLLHCAPQTREIASVCVCVCVCVCVLQTHRGQK